MKKVKDKTRKEINPQESLAKNGGWKMIKKGR